MKIKNKTIMGKWHLERVNQNFEMARVNGQAIECRHLKWWEKIIYWYKINIRYF